MCCEEALCIQSQCCANQICKDCLTEYLITTYEQQLNLQSVKLKCFNESCTQEYKADKLVALVSDSAELMQVLFNHYIHVSKDVRKCPSKNCKGAGFLPLSPN